MKVCKVEEFPGDKVICLKCKYCHVKFDFFYCEFAAKGYERTAEYHPPPGSEIPSEGKRSDCPYIECEGIKDDLHYYQSIDGHEAITVELSNDSIKFIKACEEE